MTRDNGERARACEWLPPALAAEYVGLTPRALEDMRYRKTGPEYTKVNNRIVRYLRKDLDAWLESGRVRA